MKKKILYGLLVVIMCICLVGCGNNNSNNQEQGTNDSGKTNTNDVVKVTDSAKQVADKFNLDYDNVTVNYYFIDGYTDPSGGTIRVHLKDAVEKTERQKDIISLCEYFKTASDDGKVYSNQDMSKEFNSAVVLDTTYFMSIYFKINDKSYKATITQKDSIKNNDKNYYGYDIYIADLSY